MPPQNINEIDLNNLSFSEPSINTSGARTVYVKNGARRIQLFTPKSQLVFGINDYNSDSKRFSLHIMLHDSPFKEFLTNFNETILNNALSNNTSWFGKNIPIDIIKNLFYSKNDSIFKARLPTKNDCFDGNVYDAHGNVVDLSLVKSGCFVELLIECTGLYFIAKEFGVSWKILQIKVYPNDSISHYMFDSDDDLEEDAEPPDGI